MIKQLFFSPVIPSHKMKLSISTLLCSISLISCGGGGSSDTPSNMGPIVSVGENITVNEGVNVVLAGVASDSDGSIASYEWEQISGTPVELEGENSASLVFSAPSVDTKEDLVFRLSVQDDDGAVSTDSIALTINPVNFAFTLSDVETNCGNPVSESVVFSFYDSEGNVDDITIEHDGIEQTYYIDPQGDEEARTIKVVKNGTNEVIVDVERSTSLYFEMEAQTNTSCECPLYNITLSGESGASTFNTVLILSGNRGLGSLAINDGLVWSNIEICDSQQNSVYIVDYNIEKSAQVSISVESEVSVVGLNDMALSVLIGDEPVYSGASSVVPYSQNTAYITNDSTGKLLEAIPGFTNPNIVDSVLPYPDLEAISDYRQRVRFPIDYIDFSVTSLPEFFSGSGFVSAPSIEQHTIKVSKSELASGFDFEAFDFTTLDVELSSEELLVSGVGGNTFDSVLFYAVSPSKTTLIWLPIENNRVNLTALENVVLELDEYYMIVFLVDYQGVSDFNDSVQNFYIRRESGQSVISRSVYTVIR